MKKDLIVAGTLFLIVLGGGILIRINQNNSYSMKQENDEMEIELYDILDNAKSLNYNLNENDEMLETNYTVEEIYQSIYKLNEGGINTIPADLNDIYVNFYKYYTADNNFYNMYGESYDYDEYNFIKEHHIMRNDNQIFGLYITTYSKCEVFGLVDVTDRNSMLEEYCKVNE